MSRRASFLRTLPEAARESGAGGTMRPTPATAVGGGGRGRAVEQAKGVGLRAVVGR